jgi:hypothetical protein
MREFLKFGDDYFQFGDDHRLLRVSNPKGYEEVFKLAVSVKIFESFPLGPKGVDISADPFRASFS